MMPKDKTRLTPMLQQYCDEKKNYPDALLLYRLGDFYELFFEDAEIASKELGLVLTKRNDAPMCGIPWHASEMYLTKLIKAGHRVAICEQMETPEEAKIRGGSNATIERKVTRIITKGTLIEQELLVGKQNNFLLAISGIDGNGIIAIAYADISTGRFIVDEISATELSSTLAKVEPAEIICNDNLLTNKEVLEILDTYKSIIRPIPSSKFAQNAGQERLAKFFGIKFIDSFGTLSKRVIEVASAIVDYVVEVYKSDKVNLTFPKLVNHSEHMSLDNFTRKSLELTTSQSGDKKSTLLYSIDRTKTAQGGRMLARWLMEPLANVEKISKRLDFVEFFAKNPGLLSVIDVHFSGFPDIERSITRIVMGKTSPRDLKCIAVSLRKALELDRYTSRYPELKNLRLSFDKSENLIETLEKALTDEVPFFARDGGFIRHGFDAELDEYVNFLENGESVIKELQMKYVKETGIQTLKIKNNSLIGYFIEVSPNFASKVPYNFVHRQSLATSMRYSSAELNEIANKIYSAESNAKRRELVIFEDLIKLVVKEEENIRKISENISFIDLCSSFASLAIEKHYVRPELTSEKVLEIKNGRHPVVENSLSVSGDNFVANDCDFSQTSFVSILTGPNMGGKSTYLRQNAIIIIMAQIGSFVPADYAKIGVVDRIFSRVGASDDISSGRSTFMIEMIETATILQNATEKSFVILDEIGRGTSTYDGLAIAWAVIEDIITRIKTRTIFATHYHELNGLKATQPNVKFLSVTVQEWNSQIVFLHKIKEGFTDKSYGINVASLAGFPKNVVNRAEEILKSFV
ncbi:MAG: DNA mismatch repair protein MutS [Alphaproteobacteria bacterium]|nr:DNA mismatch repair protein MutS [Alphaproteobacteria bacterium]